jgi:integrase
MLTKPRVSICWKSFQFLCFFLIIFSLVGTTLAHYHAFIAQVLKHAVAVGDVLRNPLGGMRAPKRRPKPVNSLTPDKVAEVSTKLNNMGPTPLAIAARLALMTGMRRGEICALRWQDVNLSKRQIHVVHALSKAKGFVMDTPKDVAGKDSRRTISFGPRLAKILAERKDAMREEHGKLADWDESLFVVGDPVTGAFFNPQVLGREWAMLARAENWRGTQGDIVHFHDLRHTFATLAIANHVDVMTVADLMGHKDVSTTLNVYAIALEESKRAAMDEMDAILS